MRSPTSSTTSRQRPIPGVPIDRARIVVVDHGDTVLNGFSDKAHQYASSKLEELGVELLLGIGVSAVDQGSVTLSDGTTIATHVVVWAGGEKAAGVIEPSGLAQGRGGRVDVEPDLTVAGHPDVYVLGDAANIRDEHGDVLPQLGSVAQQSGKVGGGQHRPPARAATTDGRSSTRTRASWP